MQKDIILLSDITRFQTKEEEFNPYPWYRKMLSQGPTYHEDSDTWHVFHYDSVKRVLSDYELFSSVRTRTTINVGADSKESTIADRIDIINVDPPEHRKRRSLLAAAFTPRSLQLWEPRIQAVADELIEQFIDRPDTDLISSFTSPIPIIIMADLLGVPSKDRHLFKEWVDILFLPSTNDNFEEINNRKRQAGLEYYTYLYPIVVSKRSNPADDIISDLLRAEVDGERFTDDEIVRVTMFILGAGVETTSHLLGNSFYSLLYDQPELYGELRKNPELVPLAVEEFLRYRFNTSKMDRTVKEDNNVLGVELKKGDVVVAWMSTANMDEAMFEDPFTLNIHRSNNKKHLSFGNGPHFCLGAPLARLEANIALTSFVKAFSSIEPVEGFNLEDHLMPSAAGQSLSRLPVRLYKG